MHLHTYPSLLLELDETHHFCTCLCLPHTHTSLSLSLSLSLPPPLFPLSLSQLKNLPGILRNPKIRGECTVGRVFILLITISSGSYTSFLDRRIARYLSGVWGRNGSQRTAGFFLVPAICGNIGVKELPVLVTSTTLQKNHQVS